VRYPNTFDDDALPRGLANEYISCPDIRDPHAFAARIAGDSMAPKYAVGDVVVFSPNAPVANGDDCFVRFEDGTTTFKRVYMETRRKRAVVILKPRNRKHPAQEYPRESIAGIFRAVYKYVVV